MQFTFHHFESIRLGEKPVSQACARLRCIAKGLKMFENISLAKAPQTNAAVLEDGQRLLPHDSSWKGDSTRLGIGF